MKSDSHSLQHVWGVTVKLRGKSFPKIRFLRISNDYWLDIPGLAIMKSIDSEVLKLFDSGDLIDRLMYPELTDVTEKEATVDYLGDLYTLRFREGELELETQSGSVFTFPKDLEMVTKLSMFCSFEQLDLLFTPDENLSPQTKVFKWLQVWDEYLLTLNRMKDPLE